jgi:hypothetical protein
MRMLSWVRSSCFIFTGLVLTGGVSSGDIIPANRRIDWTPGTVVGVPGGIPNRKDIGANVKSPPYNAVGDGVTDDTAAIVAAKNACPANKVVYFPAGTYKFNPDVTDANGNPARNFTRSNVTFRGAGMGLTKVKPTGGNPVYVGNGEWPVVSPTITITSGATAGSTTVTVDSTANINIGKLITITQTNPTFVHYSTVYGGGPTDDGHDQTRLMSVAFKVTGKTSSTVTFSPPLPCDMPNSPMITSWKTYIVSGTGFEDMTFDMSASTANSAIQFLQTYGCWLKNVEVAQAYSRQFWFAEAVNCEIRGCYTHDNRGGGPNHEGIDLLQNCCWNLIEDNICVRAGYPMIILGDWGGGCMGNVIAYNYLEDERSGNTYAGMSICDSHGGHNMFNLYEGNIMQTFAADGYYGSASHGTVFRNAITGYYTPVTNSSNQVPIAVMLNRWSTSYNVVGNVLGSSSNLLSVVYDQITPNYSALIPTILRLGYPAYNTGYSSTASNPDNTTTSVLDTDVRSTLLLHGNYNYVQRTVSWADPDHSLRDSYYLARKPSWWPGTVAWPPIGPDKVPMAGAIPAQMRWQTLTGQIPTSPKNAKIGAVSTPTPTPTPIPVPSPTATPVNTPTPAPTPSAAPSPTPTPVDTVTPTPTPSDTSTPAPTP